MLKKLLLTLGLIFLPFTAFAATTVPWTQVNLSDTFITPSLVNGVILGIQIKGASSTLQNFTGVNATTSQATSTNLFATTGTMTGLFGTNITGFGLTTCNGTSALTFSGTTFGCTAQPQGTITSLTGDVTGSGTGAVATTLATVNTNVGSFTNANITVNGKGLITAASNGSGGGVTSVSNSDGTITASPTTGAVVVSRPAITGDITIAGASNASVLATVNSNVGSFGGANSIPSFTVNGKGLITAAAANVPTIPASEITSGAFGSGNYTFPGTLGVTAGLTTLSNLLLTGSSTFQAFTATTATTSQATSTSLAISGISGSTQCLHVNTNGTVSGTGSDCGSGGGAVSSVSNADGTLTISPTTGSVVASIALGHANTWSALQTFGAGFLSQASSTNVGRLTVSANFGVGTTTDTALISTQGTSGGTVNYFDAASSTGQSVFSVSPNASGQLGIGIAPTSFALEVLGTSSTTSLFTTQATTSTFAITNISTGNCLQTTTGGAVIGSGSACGSGTGGGNSKFATTTGTLNPNAISPNGGTSTLVGVGTSTPSFQLESSSTTGPQLSLDNQSGGTNSKHLLFNYNGQQLNIGTSSDTTFTSTSTSLSLNTLGSAAFSIGSSSPFAIFSLQAFTGNTSDIMQIATSTGAPVQGVDKDGHPYTSGTAPAISTCGTGTGTVVGDDQTGTVTTATAATACTVTFAKAWAQTPVCTVTDNSLVGFADISSISGTAVTFGISSALTGGNLYYQCSSHR